MARRLIPDPGSAQDLVYVVPDSEAFQGVLVFIHGTLTTSADVGNRDVTLIITGKSGNIVAEFQASTQQPESTDFEYTWGGTGTPYLGSGGDKVHIPMEDFPLLGGDEIRLNQVGGNGDDQWSGVLISVSQAPGELEEL